MSVRTTSHPHATRPSRLSLSRVGVYLFLCISALFFLAPVYVVVVTAFKTMPEIREGTIFALPAALDFSAFIKAWSRACSGRVCEGVQPGLVASFKIVLPSTLLSVVLGALNGYALSFWRFRFSELIFSALLLGAVIPIQVFIFPLVKLLSVTGLFGTLPGLILIHTCFGLPIMTLLFRNYFAAIPMVLINAARVDGAGFWTIFVWIVLPMSVPILFTSAILQVTWTWNDFVFGLFFSGRDNIPITVLLNNIVNSELGEIEYNVNMAATLITASVPILVFFASGRWFSRGLSDGALKG